MIPLELVYEILKAGRGKEILLFEPERLAGRPGIVRIQDTGNVFGVVLPFNRPQIMHVVEKLQVESVFRARFPQAEAVHGSGIKPDYGHIVGGGGNFLGVLDPVRGMTIGSLVGHRRAAEGTVTARSERFTSRIAMFEPVVRYSTDTRSQYAVQTYRTGTVYRIRAPDNRGSRENRGNRPQDARDRRCRDRHPVLLLLCPCN